MKFWLWLLGAHLLLCLIVFFCARLRVLKFSLQLFPLVLLVPVWGLLIAAVAEWDTRRHKTGTKPIDLEELHLDDYRLLGLQDDESLEAVVPLEEAFHINDAATRRQLMVEILHQDPNQYIQLLQQARLNNDIEVTHYASTAMMEVQREHEIEIQRLEKRLKDNADDPRALDDCLRAYARYIESGLLEDSVLFIQRKRYGELLGQKLERQPNDAPTLYEAIVNDLEQKDYGSASSRLQTALSRWPREETPWLLKIRYCFATGDGRELENTVARLQRQEIYLTAEGREAVRFWKDEAQKGGVTDETVAAV